MTWAKRLALEIQRMKIRPHRFTNKINPPPYHLRMNINCASCYDLIQVPMIGCITVGKILLYQKQMNYNITDITTIKKNIRGIGIKKQKQLELYFNTKYNSK